MFLNSKIRRWEETPPVIWMQGRTAYIQSLTLVVRLSMTMWEPMILIAIMTSAPPPFLGPQSAHAIAEILSPKPEGPPKGMRSCMRV